MKRNVPLLGFVIGAILPLIGIFIVYLILFRSIAFPDFVKDMIHMPTQATKVISLGILINIPVSYTHLDVYKRQALGMAIASKLKGEHQRQHVAVIGDGAMTAGLPFEAMNHAGVSNSNVLIILNDNNMSIDPNVGALKEYLTDITTSHTYNLALIHI